MRAWMASPMTLALALAAALGLAGCGSQFAVRGIDYDLSEAEAAHARAWRAAEPVEAAAACRYWDAKQSEAGRVHQQGAHKVGEFRQLRLWTQANRIARCTDAGASDKSAATLPGAAPQAEDAPPPEVAPTLAPADEDAPPPPSGEPTADEDAPPPG